MKGAFILLNANLQSDQRCVSMSHGDVQTTLAGDDTLIRHRVMRTVTECMMCDSRVQRPLWILEAGEAEC